MKRSAPLRRRIRLRSVGVVTRRRQARLREILPLLLERAGGCCENPLCKGRARLDPHHVQKRSQGGGETLDNLVALCRWPCHDALDLPDGHRDALRIWRVDETVTWNVATELARSWFVFTSRGFRMRRELLDSGRRFGPPENYGEVLPRGGAVAPTAILAAGALALLAFLGLTLWILLEAA